MRKCGNSLINSPTKSSASYPAASPVWLQRRSLLSARAPAPRKSGMDYDGSNQRPAHFPEIDFAHSALVARRFAHRFHCFAPNLGLTSAQICMFSMDTGKLVSFPRFRGTNITPTWSPDGTQVVFSSSMQGNPSCSSRISTAPP